MTPTASRNPGSRGNSTSMPLTTGTRSSRSIATSASCAGAACGHARRSTAPRRWAWPIAALTPRSRSAWALLWKTALASSAGSACRSARRGPDRKEGHRQGARLGNAESQDHLPLLRGRLPAGASRQGRPDRQGHRRGRRRQPNKGRLCVKGRYGYDFIYSEDRLTRRSSGRRTGTSGRPPGTRHWIWWPTNSRRSSPSTGRMRLPA